MTYDNFKQQLISMSEGRLPESTSIEVKQILKNNDQKLDGLLISTPEVNISPTIYLERYYEAYQQGQLLTDIVAQVLHCYETFRKEESVDISFFEDFSKVSSRIVYKLINAKKNKELLKDIPFIPYLDLAICFCYYVSCGSSNLVGEDSSATILIHNSHMENWKVTPADLIRLARKNTPKLLGMEMKPLSDLIYDMPGHEEFMEDLATQIPLYMLTNHARFIGAAVVLYQGLLEKCAELFDSNFYILPSSIHEVLLLPSNQEYSSKELSQLVCMVNQNELSPEEVLADHVYYYNRQSNEVVFENM